MTQEDNGSYVAPAQSSEQRAKLETRAWNTRRAPHMERFVELRPIAMRDNPDAHVVFLRVEHQSFEIGPCASETREHAEWMRDMLCIALDRLVRLATGTVTSPHVAQDDRSNTVGTKT